jgi:hypothetical protein
LRSLRIRSSAITRALCVRNSIFRHFDLTNDLSAALDRSQTNIGGKKMRTAILRTLVCYAAPFSVACSAAEGDSLDPNGDGVAVSEQALLPTPITIRFDSGGADRAAVVASDGTGGVLVGGSIPHPQFNSFGVAKFDAQGQLVWRTNPVLGGTTGLVTAIADMKLDAFNNLFLSLDTLTFGGGLRVRETTTSSC